MKYVAILRGINVGGKRKILMTDLKQLFLNLGFTNVRTYIQSGNVIFESNSSQNLSTIIESAILGKFDFTVPVIVKSHETLSSIIDNSPFNLKDASQHYVSYLKEVPSLDLTETFNENSFDPDQFLISDHAVYIFCNTKYSNTKLTNTFIEKKLKVTTTTRNWKTTLKIQELLAAND